MSEQAALPTLSELYRAVNSAPWPGTPTSRNVYLALIQTAQKRNEATVKAAVRWLANYTGASLDSVSRALRWLSREGHVKTHYSYTGGTGLEAANAYTLPARPDETDPLAFALRAAEDMSGGDICNSRTSKYSNLTCSEITESEGKTRDEQPEQPEKPHIIWKELGQSSALVYGAMNGEPLSVTALERSTGKTWKTVSEALKKLRSAGLVEVTPKGWMRTALTVKEASEQFTAAELTRGRRAVTRKRRDKALSERAYKAWCEEWDSYYDGGEAFKILVIGGSPRLTAEQMTQAAQVASRFPCVNCGHTNWEPTDTNAIECGECHTWRAFYDSGYVMDGVSAITNFDNPGAEHEIYAHGNLIPLEDWYTGPKHTDRERRAWKEISRAIWQEARQTA